MFRSPSQPPESQSLENQLAALERQAKIALPGFDAQFFNRAGDLCVESDERRRALQYYGRAIDAYLEAGRFNAAGAVCRKLLRISPNAVRARCTLAWVCIGKGLLSDAKREVEQYVEAALRAGQEDLARKQVRMMAEATLNPELRQLLADNLRRLDDDDAAAEVAGAGPDGPTEDAEQLWARVLRAALMGPDELGSRD